MVSRAPLCIALLVATAACVAAQAPGPGPEPGAGCSMATEKKACGKEKGCVWCEGTYAPGSCYDKAQAAYLPKQFFKCKKPKNGGATAAAAAAAPRQAVAAEPNPAPGPGPTPGAGCSMATDKKACGKEKGCLWCEGTYGPGSCYSKDQAKYLPPTIYKCKKPKSSLVQVMMSL